MATIQTKLVVLLAYPGMNLLDLCGPLQAFTTANRRCSAALGNPLYRTVVASNEGGLVITGASLPLMTVPLAPLDDEPIDTLIAAGGCKEEVFHAPPALVGWIARRAPTIRRVCSVCTGAFLLAAAGQLEGRRATTHWDWASRLQESYPSIDVDADKIFVQDGNIWTSAGISAGIDLALALIEDDFGHQAAIETARQLVVFIKRSGGQSQFSMPLAAQSHRSGRFAALQAWIAVNLQADLRIDQLAERVGMAPRTFTRTYTKEVGQSPMKTVEAMRLEAACRALEESTVPLKRIAALVGYSEERNLRRMFQRQLGISPNQYRNRFSARKT